MKEDKCSKIFEFIRNYILTENMSPSVREICEGVGYSSTSTVYHYLQKLKDAGKISMTNGKNRSIVIPEEDLLEPEGIPLLGKVAAGHPITAEQDIEEYVDFIPAKNYAGELFALRVQGDSMINIGIYDGDIVIVERTPVADNGEVVVAMVDGPAGSEATVKTFYKENGYFRLQPENDEMKPFIVKEVTILGRVVSLIRYF